MISSLLVGTLLGMIYSFSSQKRALRASQGLISSSRSRLIFNAILRLVLIASTFFVVLKIPFLDFSLVLLSFITIITLCLFNLARKSFLPLMRAGGTQSQGRF